MNKADRNTPIMLIILDGFGHSPKSPGNAVAHAKMPFWDWLIQNYPHTLLHAAGKAVGLPPRYIGNSEVGHLTIGAGRIVESILKKFHDEITGGNFFENKMLIRNFNKIKETGKALHLIGLLSDGGVHSHESHLYAFLKLAKNLGLKNVFIHVILDGRDVAPKSAATYLNRLEDECKKLDCGKIASISGRFYAMDRDNNWSRTQQFYDMLVGANPAIHAKQPLQQTQGERGKESARGELVEPSALGQRAEFQKPYNTSTTWQTIINQAYGAGKTDEFITPTLIDPNGFIKHGDGVVFFNFRPDRAQQITESFINPNFDKFPTQNLCSSKLNSKNGELAFFITPTKYNENFAKFNNDILFEREKIKNTLLDIFAMQRNPFKVFIIAETEKYAHVTYFFHGMQDHQTSNETRVLIPSIKTENYINYPEMCANEITTTVLNSLKTDPADFYLINYANADMVGHSGDFNATVKACECLDKQLEQLYKVFVEKMNGTMFITADHGNAEEKMDVVTGTPLTAHTQNPVPFVLVSKYMQSKQDANWPIKPKFGISSIAPTILNFIGLKEPKEMTGKKIEF
ncbi:MAG: 2,3-bisphosphoglycerate-independent phosphoglycerate mutase [bacterium]